MKIPLINNQSGIALILTLLLMTMILCLSLYILNFSLTESRIAKSQVWGEKNYYLAEAGIQEMLWKLKNDAAYRNGFQTNPNWTASFTRSDPFGGGSGSYAVSIVNDLIAHGEITASSSIAVDNRNFSQRVIKTKVYRLISESGMGTNAVMNGGGTINILNSSRVVITGDTYSSSAIIMQGSNPEFEITGDLTTLSDITEGNGDLTVSGTITDQNSSPPPTQQLLPGIDFNSLLSRAATIIANDAGLDATSTLGGIVWVNTAASISQDMTINGLLVVNGNLTINNSADIIVNHSTGLPSGIVVNGNIIISKNPSYNGEIVIDGLLYSTGQIILEKLKPGYLFKVTGGITSGNGLLIKNCSRTIEIIFDNDILIDSLDSSSESPILVIEHWEEEY